MPQSETSPQNLAEPEASRRNARPPVQTRNEKDFFPRSARRRERLFLPPSGLARLRGMLPSGEGKNIAAKRLTTASNVLAAKGRLSAGATSKSTLIIPSRSAARRPASTISGDGSIPETLPSRLTRPAIVSAGSPGPVPTSKTRWPRMIFASATSASVTGANIVRMTARCFSQ